MMNLIFRSSEVDHKISSNEDTLNIFQRNGKHNVKVKLNGELVTETPIGGNLLSRAESNVGYPITFFIKNSLERIYIHSTSSFTG